MAEALEKLLSFPSEKTKKASAKEYDREITSFLNTINKIHAPAWTKTIDKKPLVDMLDPAINSLAYLFALTEEITANANTKSSKQLAGYIDRAHIFFTSFDPVQVRYGGKQWRELYQWLAQMLVQQEANDVSSLVGGLLRLDPTAGTFTSNHLDLLHTALRLGVPSQTLPILDRNIYAFPSHNPKSVGDDLPSEDLELSNTVITDKSGFSRKLDSQMVLEYYLLGGTIYLGSHNYHRARLFLEQVILSPTQQRTPSTLQVEAYKRWLIAGLFAQGAPWPTPRTLDAATAKTIQAVCKAYEALADGFAKRDAKKFRAEAELGAEQWRDDANHALVTATGQALDRYRVIDLAKTYAALPVTRVALLLEIQADATLQLLQKLILDRHLDASLSGSGDTTVLRFHSVTSPGDVTNGDTLEEQTVRIQQLVTSVRDADRRLQLTKEYVDWQKRNKKLGALDGEPADLMDLSWDGPNAADDDADEDIMGA